MIAQSATGSLSSNGGISCSATSSTSNTSSFDNSLVATSKVQTIGGKEQIGVNSFNLVSQVWSVYNSLKTSEANLQKTPKYYATMDRNPGQAHAIALQGFEHQRERPIAKHFKLY